MAIAVGCGHGAAAAPPSVTTTPTSSKSFIAQPCEDLGDTRKPTNGKFGRVFLQGADVLAAELSSPLDAWLKNNPVTVNHVQSMLIEGDKPVAVSWARCIDKDCRTTQVWQLRITPRLPDAASNPLWLMIQLAPEGGDLQEPGVTVETRDQTPVVVSFPEGSEGATSIVFTPYLIGGDEDLRLLAMCKARLSTCKEAGFCGIPATGSDIPQAEHPTQPQTN